MDSVYIHAHKGTIYIISVLHMELNTHMHGTPGNRFYPLFIDLRGRSCLVIGGGGVGERKIRGLLRCGADIRLVARQRTPWLENACSNGDVRFVGEEYSKAQLIGIVLVFAATSDPELNRRIRDDALEFGVWCNMATDPELGSFIVPSLVERGPLSIAISTAGLSPAIAKSLRLRLENEFGAEWDFFIQLLGALRKSIISAKAEEDDSRRVFNALAALPLPEWLKRGEGEKAFLRVSETCGPLLKPEELQSIWDRLWKPFFSSLQRSAT